MIWYVCRRLAGAAYLAQALEHLRQLRGLERLDRELDDRMLAEHNRLLETARKWGEELARLQHEMLSDSRSTSAIAEGKGEIKDKGS